MNPVVARMLTFDDVAEIINRYDEINERNPIPSSSEEAIEILLAEVRGEIDTLPEQEHPIYELNQILLDWVREAKTDKEHETRFEAHKRFFELYDEYMEQEPEQPVEGLEEEIETEADKTFFANGWYEGKYHQPRLDISLEEYRDIARHFAEWGAEHLKR